MKYNQGRSFCAPENATRRLYHFNAVKSIAHEEKNLHSKYKEDIMLKVFIELFVICLLGVEMYFCTAGNRHRRKKILKGWNPVKGTITAIDKKGRKETLIGTLPLLALIVVCAVITLIAHLAGK